MLPSHRILREELLRNRRVDCSRMHREEIHIAVLLREMRNHLVRGRLAGPIRRLPGKAHLTTPAANVNHTALRATLVGQSEELLHHVVRRDDVGHVHVRDVVDGKSRGGAEIFGCGAGDEDVDAAGGGDDRGHARVVGGGGGVRGDLN